MSELILIKQVKEVNACLFKLNERNEEAEEISIDLRYNVVSSLSNFIIME